MDIPKTFIPKDKSSCDAERLLDPKQKPEIIEISNFHEKIAPKNLDTLTGTWMNTHNQEVIHDIEQLLRTIDGYEQIDKVHEFKSGWFTRAYFHVRGGTIWVYFSWDFQYEPEPIRVYGEGRLYAEDVENVLEEIDVRVKNSEYFKKK